MNPIDKTDKSQSASIEFEFEFDHPPEKVWRALTDPVLLETWLLPAVDHKLLNGAAFKFMAQPQPGWDGIVHCEYLEIEPFEKLSCTWVVGDIDTVVTFRLTPTETGTRMTLVQSGFRPEQKRNFGGARYGWTMMGKRLVDLLST